MGETKYFTNDPPNTSAAPPSSNLCLTLAYRTIGNLKNPAVFMPSCYSGTLDDTLPFLYAPPKDSVLENYFVILCGLLGAGESSSPSNAPASQRGARFPALTYEDNARMQHALCRALGVTHLFAYIGFSMGGQQAYHLAALYPDFATRIVVLASSARTSWHNYSFLEGPKAALVNSVDFLDGAYHPATPPVRGVRAFWRVYATLGFASLEAYLNAEWDFASCDAHDLLCQLHMWQKGDISVFGPEGERGDLGKALGRIGAKVLLMPCRTDLYFPPEDSEEEVKYLKKGELRVIESIWGHLAGGGSGTREDDEFIKTEIRRFLQT
ncbi:alpha/beta hydrolase fold protein [Mycena haematopus]|nr:alpha/beta hydrolase fold protein [Mycena haematopus]